METTDARKVPVEVEEARRSSLNEQGIAANQQDLRDIGGHIAARLPMFGDGRWDSLGRALNMLENLAVDRRCSTCLYVWPFGGTAEGL